MEKKHLKMNDFNQTACDAKRNFTFPVIERQGDFYKKVAATNSIVHDCFRYGIDIAGIPQLVEDRFADIPYLSPAQREAYQEESFKQIKRYVSSERRLAAETGRVLHELGQKEIELNDDVVVTVTPSFWAENCGGTELEVIKLRCGKSPIKKGDIEKDLGLYSMLKYAEELAKGNSNIKTLVASYYFLGKASDHYSGANKNFDSDFFLNKGGENNSGGLNIVQLTAEVSNMPAMDKTYGALLQTFMDGKAASDCTREECEKCNLHDICKYEPAPKTIKEPEKKKRTKEDILLMLTDSQQQVVTFDSGYCVVNAGAGSGKTQSLAVRVANLILGFSGNTPTAPEKICLVTFTNSGAEAMRSRIGEILQIFYESDDIPKDEAEKKATEVAGKITIQTFNAFGDDVIKDKFVFLGFSAPPTVIDDVERAQIIVQMLNEEVVKPYYDADGKQRKHPLKELDWRNFYMNTRYVKGALPVVKDVFDYMKSNSIPPTKTGAALVQRIHPVSMACAEVLVRLFNEYENKLLDDNKIEYSDQEAMLFTVVNDDPFYFERYGFEHIMVDEYQDTTENQLKIVKFMCDTKEFKSLMVVGDDSQAIYGFRNTSPEFIINFDSYFPGKHVTHIKLCENFRSTPEILDFANQINAMNVSRVDKDLIAVRPSGLPVNVQGFHTPEEERAFVINEIKHRLATGRKPEDIAVICYTKYELLKMATLLDEAHIPLVMLNPEAIAENSRVLAAKALISAIDNPDTNRDAMIYANAAIGGGLLKMDEEEILDAVSAVLDKIDAYRLTVGEEEKKALLMEMLLEIDPEEDEIYRAFLDTITIKSLDGIFAYIRAFDAYGSTVAIRREHKYPGVVLTTAHSSKGLEWPVVFNMITEYDFKGACPGRAEEEERRRLLFVSATRAMDELIVTSQYITNTKKPATGKLAKGQTPEYIFNEYLIDALKAVGIIFSSQYVIQEKVDREIARKKALAEARKKRAAAKKATAEEE